MAGRIYQATIGNLPELLRSGKPVVVDFWASWCAPCHAMTPILRNLADEFDGQIIFAKINASANRDLVNQFKVRNIPTMIMFRNGKEWDRISGMKTRPELRKLFRKLSS